jgi:hypothetical protein
MLSLILSKIRVLQNRLIVVRDWQEEAEIKLQLIDLKFKLNQLIKKDTKCPT